MKNSDITPLIKSKPVAISLGQEVILEAYSCGSSNNEKKVRHAKVTKMGRKHFYVGEYKFEIETLRHVDKIWGVGWKLYLSQQIYEEQKEKERVLVFLQSYFSYKGGANTLPLTKLREIEELIHKAD